MTTQFISVKTHSGVPPAAEADPMDFCALGLHLKVCKGSTDRMFILHCLLQDLREFLAARVVTSLVLAVGLIGLMSLVV